MKLASAKAMARDEPDLTAEPSADPSAVRYGGTNKEVRENLRRLRAQMIVETLTPFLGVLIGLEPDGPPSR